MSLKTTLNNMLGKITENFTIKFISLIIAVLLWFYIKNLTMAVYEFYIPLNYEGISYDSVIVNYRDLPNYVLIRVSGNKELISRITHLPKNSFYAIVDMSKTNKDKIYKVNVVLPEDIKNLKVEFFPSEVFVDLDVWVEKSVPVVIANSKDYVPIPDTVLVSTISRYVDGISNVEIFVDTSKNVDKVFLENTQFVRFYPQVVVVSNVK